MHEAIALTRAIDALPIEKTELKPADRPGLGILIRRFGALQQQARSGIHPSSLDYLTPDTNSQVFTQDIIARALSTAKNEHYLSKVAKSVSPDL